VASAAGAMPALQVQGEQVQEEQVQEEQAQVAPQLQGTRFVVVIEVSWVVASPLPRSSGGVPGIAFNPADAHGSGILQPARAAP
jgi:hypothetical protein